MSISGTASLRSKVSGTVIEPGDPRYDEARATHNGMIDKRPALIVQAANVEDVRAAVLLAHETKLPAAIRGGNHSGPGFGSSDGGIVIDLAGLKNVTVDPSNGTVQVGGGCTWGEVDKATHPHGLAVPCGVISSTGVGGLTLGGGTGYLTRKYGLTIDSLLSAEMVLADGRVVTASATSEPDLYWAIRGGGGNFGVVTNVHVPGPAGVERDRGAHRVGVGRHARDDAVLHGQLPSVARRHLWILRRADRAAGATIPRGAAHVARVRDRLVFAPECGGHSRASRAVPRVPEASRGLRRPLADAVLNSLFDGLYPKGTRAYWKGDFSIRCPMRRLRSIRSTGSRLPSVQSTMHLYPIDGAAGRVGADDTAWGYRGAKYMQRSSWVRTAIRRTTRRSRAGRGILAGRPPVFVRQRLRKLPDGR